ncbi:MAG: winged helix-turn-helix transcriptional regulator [Candidatus Nezhaarchaeales archaeon]
MKGTDFLRILGRAFAIEIMEELSKRALRFVDLKNCCPNDRTRSLRLKELKKLGLIDVVVKDVGGRYSIHYQLTEKGRRALKLINELRELLAE